MKTENKKKTIMKIKIEELLELSFEAEYSRTRKSAILI